jgi:hypothetical protein
MSKKGHGLGVGKIIFDENDWYLILDKWMPSSMVVVNVEKRPPICHNL